MRINYCDFYADLILASENKPFLTADWNDKKCF